MGEQVRRYTPAIVLTVSLFLPWGMANNLNDILIAQFRRGFALLVPALCFAVVVAFARFAPMPRAAAMPRL